MRKGTKTAPLPNCYCLKIEFLMQEMDFKMHVKLLYQNLMIHKLYESQFPRQKKVREMT